MAVHLHVLRTVRARTVPTMAVPRQVSLPRNLGTSTLTRQLHEGTAQGRGRLRAPRTRVTLINPAGLRVAATMPGPLPSAHATLPLFAVLELRRHRCRIVL